MKILIIGLGSIGRRHLSILKVKDHIEVAAFRTKKGELNSDVEVLEFYNISEALNFNPDGVVISNPTSLHAITALPFLKKGIKVLIEKPITATLTENNLLEPYSELIRCAYCLRFLKLYKELEFLFQKDPPFKVDFKRSFYLPKWHPYADYKKEYTAQKALGGGVIRTLSHEIDLALSWFDYPQKITGLVDKLSSLEIDTEDYALLSMRYNNKSLRVNIELDFYSPENINSGEAFTRNGKYEWDMTEITFQEYEGKKQLIYKASANELDMMYESQLIDFIDFVKTDKSGNATWEDGYNLLKIIDEIEKR